MKLSYITIPLILMVCFAHLSPGRAQMGSKLMRNVIPPSECSSKELPFELVEQKGHASRVYYMRFTPDSKIIISASNDGTIKLWDIATCNEIRTIVGGGRFAVSNGGTMLIGIEKDPKDHAAIWDLCTGKILLTFDTPDAEKNVFAFSRDDAMIAHGGPDKTITLRDTRTGAVIKTLSGHTGAITALAFSREGGMIVSGSADGTFRYWGIEEGREVGCNKHHGAAVNALAFSPVSTLLATSGEDGTTAIWNYRVDEALQLLKGTSNENMNALTFSPDGTSIWVFTPDGRYVSYNLLKKEVEASIPTGDEVSVLSPDGKIIASSTGYVWDASTGEKIRTVKGYSRAVNPVLLSADGKTLVSHHNVSFYTNFSYTNHRQLVKIWDLETMREKSVVSTNALLGMTPDVKHLAVLNDGRIKIIETETGKETAEMKVSATLGFGLLFGQGYDSPFEFSRDGSQLVTAYGKDLVLQDSITLKEIRRFVGHTSTIDRAAISPDGKLLASVSNEDGRLILWNAPTGSPIGSPVPVGSGERGKGAFVLSFTSDGKRLGVIPRDTRAIRFFSIPGLKPAGEISDAPRLFYSLAFSSDGKWIAAASGPEYRDSGKNRLQVFDAATGKLSKTLIADVQHINSMSFSGDGTLLACGLANGTVRLWNLSKDRGVSFFCSADEWVVYTPEGYFDGSKYGGQLVSAVQGMMINPIDQFATMKNRPDIILESMGFGTAELLDHYRAQYRKRLKKSGFTEEMLSAEMHVPTAVITAVKQDDKMVTVQCTISDTDYALRRYNIFVNDVPLFGAYGRDIDGGVKKLDINEKFELTTGQNKIEISCINEKGAESYRALTYAEYRQQTRGDLYYLGFGVSKYRNESLNLQYADKDARDLAELFTKMKGVMFNEVYARVYADREVTADNVKKAKEMLKNAKPDDTFVLFIAGQGMHDNDRESTYYYLTYDAELGRLSATAVNFEMLEDLMQGIAPRNKLFLMDTCESGEVDDVVQTTFYTSAKSRGIKARAARGVVFIDDEAKEKPAQKKRDYLFQRDRFIYNDLSRRSGAIVFSSSKGGEFSYESESVQNGFFTEEIIRAITSGEADADGDGAVSIDELRNFVAKEVPALTSDLQHPTIDRDNIYQKFGFPAGQ
jgi:WD40 repeat protein/uncharacterized caspase-like protein